MPVSIGQGLRVLTLLILVSLDPPPDMSALT